MPTPPIPIAMPVAHVTGGPNYTSYYVAGTDPIFEVTEYFNERVTATTICQGFRLNKSPAAPASTSAALFNLYAFTQGYLSYKSPSLVLRLPRELNKTAALQQYNSGGQFLELQPGGPQLRHVVYRFDGTPPTTQIQTAIQNILNNTSHPTRTLVREVDASGKDVSLGDYLNANSANLTQELSKFMSGTLELFVLAGEVIGTFASNAVEIRFHDSCGTPIPQSGSPAVPPPANSRPLNPSYFLYLVRHTRNAARVSMLTSFHTAPPSRNETHPLEYLLSPAVLGPRQTSPDLELNVNAALPPKPIHYIVQVQNSSGTFLSERGIALDALGEWHESRNASNPNTSATVRWRHIGSQTGDTRADYCKLRAEVKPARSTLVPAGFNDQFPPLTNHTNIAIGYWQRYGAMFNAVARALEIPCELLVAIACTESGGSYSATWSSSREMVDTRFEPLTANISAMTSDPTKQAQLQDYKNIAGTNGANRDLPIPWNGGGRLSSSPSSTLTWDQLAQLVEDFPKKGQVNISPGVSQVTIRTGIEDIAWFESLYGDQLIRNLSVTVDIIFPPLTTPTPIRLTADDPPNNRRDLFKLWFAVMADSTGNTTTNGTSAHTDLTKYKRAFHCIIAQAVHIKRRYNCVLTAGSTGKLMNFVTDFDLPTTIAGYNSGNVTLNPATTSMGDPDRWVHLFGMDFFDANYPSNAPRYLNAIINHFNASTLPTPLPALRLWRE